MGNIPREGHDMGRKVPSHLVVLGHPGSNSFNAAVAGRYVEAVRATHQDAVLRDLYAIEFDPLLKENERTSNGADGASSDVRTELNLLQQCDVLTFVYPLWFGMPPAIITGYIDRVLGAGFRVDDLNRSPEGMLRGKRLAVITTSGSKLTWLEEHGMWVSLRQSFDEYLKTVFGFARCDHYHADSIVDDLTSADAERILFEVEEFARKVSASAAALQQS
jgi:NAD(P)H dehydrogenase (quinone)